VSDVKADKQALRAIARKFASECVPVCSAVDKFSYVNEARAQACARALLAAGGSEMRAYQCDYGKRFRTHWHLTSIL